MNRLIGGAILTVIIGSTAYTVSQADIAKHFAADTGLTQEQAEQYIGNLTEDDLASFYEIGSNFIDDGEDALAYYRDIDCANYEYEWQSVGISCYQGESEMQRIGTDEVALGQAFQKLDSDSASTDDISRTITLIDKVNSDLELSIVSFILSRSDIDEMKKANSYNKALLKAALESE